MSLPQAAQRRSGEGGEKRAFSELRDGWGLSPRKDGVWGSTPPRPSSLRVAAPRLREGAHLPRVTSLNMSNSQTISVPRRFRARVLRLPSTPSSKRARGTPGARCTLGPDADARHSAMKEHQDFRITDTTGVPHAVVLPARFAGPLVTDPWVQSTTQRADDASTTLSSHRSGISLGLSRCLMAQGDAPGASRLGPSASRCGRPSGGASRSSSSDRRMPRPQWCPAWRHLPPDGGSPDVPRDAAVSASTASRSAIVTMAIAPLGWSRTRPA